MTTVLVVLAPGAEEIEAITIADMMVRAKAQVTVASTTDQLVVAGSRGIPLAAHTRLDQVLGQTFDVVYLPGGMGSAQTHRDDERIQQLASAQLASGRILAVICAAPIALVPKKLCAGRTLTSIPAVRAQVEPHCAAWLAQAVVIDGNLVTSQSAGTAAQLGQALIRLTAGADVASQVSRDMLLPSV